MLKDIGSFLWHLTVVIVGIVVVLAIIKVAFQIVF